MDLDEFVFTLSARLKKHYTAEQVEFFKDFRTPLISFSKPGTGKTQSAVAGLLTAEMFHHIPGNKIIALSFTRLATAELRNRHEAACSACGIHSTVMFKTLSAICVQILKENYALLGMKSLSIRQSLTVAEMSDFLLETADGEGINLSKYKVRDVVKAIRSLNSSLIFDPAHIESKLVFKKTDLTLDEFQLLRQRAYQLNKLTEVVQMDDVFLYTLELLLCNPKLSKIYRDNIKVLFVDEFQDMSLLQLKVLSLLSDNLIAIGDINQQIYAFNGACQEIVEKYKEYYPTYRQVDLTQSFRCANSIADFATKIILPNDPTANEFKGTGAEGIVTVSDSVNLENLVSQIESDFHANHNTFKKSIMFEFRNNFSVIPLAEELYKRRIPFRANNYVPAHQVPVVKDLCEAIELVRNPSNVDRMWILKKLIPEFATYNDFRKIPLVRVAIENGLSIFDINYSFKNDEIGTYIMSRLFEVQHLLEEHVPVRELFNAIWPAYSTYYLNAHEHLLELPSTYYLALVAPLVQKKIYGEFIKDELDKADAIKECVAQRTGIRCYTLHAAKGTEADIVHMLDINEGIMPNTHKIEEMTQWNCAIDAAREIRNERSLAYVGATRAKEELHVWHTGPLSTLFTSENAYSGYDAAYKSYSPQFKDVEVFTEFYENITYD